jgi:hypothetical protein
MKKTELQSIVTPLIPKLYSFAYAMVPEEMLAEQLVMDAYAVFVVREKQFIKNFDYKEDKKEKTAVKRYILSGILLDIYQLGVKRSAQVKYSQRNKDFGLYTPFYKLNSLQRAVIFLKENFKYSTQGIQEILNLEKLQVIEAIYNGRNLILASEEDFEQGSAHA